MIILKLNSSQFKLLLTSILLVITLVVPVMQPYKTLYNKTDEYSIYDVFPEEERSEESESEKEERTKHIEKYVLSDYLNEQYSLTINGKLLLLNCYFISSFRAKVLTPPPKRLLS